MSNHKATPEQWDELRARIEQLEAQARNHPAIPDSSTPPPEPPTDDELWETGEDYFDDNSDRPYGIDFARAVRERWGHG
jgi:hypothetical protein